MAATRLIVQSIGAGLYNTTKPVSKRLFNKNFWNKCISRRYARGYEGDGKTVGFILNKRSSGTLFIDNLYTDGFALSDGTEVAGSIIIFPHSLFSWHVLRAEDVNENSLILFKILEPKVDLLIFGYGNTGSYTPKVRKQFSESCKKLGLRYEALPTAQAVGVFNFMSEDRRFAAAALIPPVEIDVLKFERTKPAFIEDEDETEASLKAIPDNIGDTKYLK